MKMIALLPLVLLILISCDKTEKPTRLFREVTFDLYDSALKPFYHGVASGDPLQDRVILWTRVTPEDSTQKISVRWEISESPDFATILKSDTLSTSSNRDFTVKIDVDGLSAGKKYYYRFNALGRNSQTGKTQTLPEQTDSVKLAVVSCANWEWGYFNAYDNIAKREDVNAIVQLGDYLYEYGHGKYGDTTIGRNHLPPHEIITLWDYRTRHAQYRLDKGLNHVSRSIPMIAIWDDHEIANDSYTKGAQNHQPEEGDYEKRKAAARQAYYEWLPIREGAKHYRSFSFGKLADLIMLDERLAGRTKPVDSISDPNFFSEERTMLGKEQFDWFTTKLKDSKATWKIIGNQVMFSDVVQSPAFRNTPRNFDSWDGFPAEKKKIEEFIRSNNLKEIVFVTGDTHASWGIEAADPNHKLALEFGTTSISSGNDDERKPAEEVKKIEAEILKLNPHIKYFNDRDHGYLLVTFTASSVRGEWWYMETLRVQGSDERLGKVMKAKAGELLLR